MKDNTVTAHTVTATNYAVGSTNFISASRQGNFRDLEVKDTNNNATILLVGDGGDITIDGTLSADTIGEKTSATGVTIDGVLLKDNDISANGIQLDNLAVRSGGYIFTNTISETTNGSGITIDGVLLKDGGITATGTTQTAGNNTTQLATTAFVKTAIDNLVDSAPGALDTLNELAAAIGDDANYAATVTTALAGKQASITTSTRLNANLIHDGSVTNTIFGRLANVTDDIQAQLNAKQASLTSTGSGEVITLLERTNLKDVSDNAVRITGNQTIAGVKTFTSDITGTLAGKAATADALHTARTIHGVSFNGTADIDLSEVIADTVGAMFSSNTETGITATYEDSDNTIDLVVGTLNQDTTGNAATVTNGVYTTGNQTIAGTKTFSSAISGSIDGNAATVTNGVYTTGVQTVAGAKTFSSAVTVGNYTLPTAAGTQGQVLKYPASGSTLTWGSSGSGGSSIDTTTDVSLNDLGVYGDLSCNAVKLGGHIIPDTNAAYDLGNAEYKIRHLFLSDNSLWVGDNHKIDIVGCKMKFKKRKTNVVPAAITAASGSDSAALAHAGVSSLAEMKLHHWEAYAHTLSGLETSNIKDIFVSGTAGDWEEDEELGGSSSTTTKKGQTLETLAGVCDGRTVVVESGSYTLGNVNTDQQLTTSWAEITGTSINYKPPTGAKYISYKLEVFRRWGPTASSGRAVAHYKLYLDSDEIVGSRTTRGGGTYEETYDTIMWTFEIGNTDDIANGKLLSWDSNKIISVKARELSGSYEVRLHEPLYWDGGESGQPTIKPRIEINSIGEGTVGAVSNAVTTSGDQTIAGTKTFSNAIISASYTTTQRDALTAVAGMVIFNTTVNKHQGYNGSSWNDFY